MDPARPKDAKTHDHKSHQPSSGPASLGAYLSTIPDNFDMFGDDINTVDTQNNTDTNQNSEVLQAFDKRYNIDPVISERQLPRSLPSNNSGTSHHLSGELTTPRVVAQSGPSSPAVISQLMAADMIRHRSEPSKQEGPDGPEQYFTSASLAPATMSRSFSTSELDTTASILPTSQSPSQKPINSLATLPIKKHLSRPLAPSPLARQMMSIPGGIETPRARTKFTVATTAVSTTYPVPEPLSTLSDWRAGVATYAPFLGIPYDGTAQAISNETNHGAYNAFNFNGGFHEHGLQQDSSGLVRPFGPRYNDLNTGLPYGSNTHFNRAGEDRTVGTNAPNYEAQLEQTRSGQALVHEAQGPWMKFQGRFPRPNIPLVYPEYSGEPNHHNQSRNFDFEVASTSQHLVLKTEQAIENTGNDAYFGQPNPRNLYLGATTPGIGFENTFTPPNDLPYYLPSGSGGGSGEGPASDLNFSSLYDFVNQQNPLNKDDSWQSDSTYPHSCTQEQSYVKEIIMAMNDMDSANDNPGMLDMWNKLKKSKGALENTAWKLLRLCNKSHKEIQSLAHGPRTPQRPRIYADHMAELCKALRDEKTICKHLLSADFADSFVDDPANAAHRVNNNRKVNGGKKVAIEKGRAAMSMVKDAQDPDDVDRELSVLKEESEQPMEGYNRQASQQLVNNGTTQGSILNSQLPAIRGMSEHRQLAIAPSTLPGTHERSSKKSAKKGSAVKNATLKNPGRRSTRKIMEDSEDEDEDLDGDESYEPSKTPKRKRANRNTKYPTTQLADGSYVIKTIPSPSATTPSRRKRQTTLEASASGFDQNVASFGRTLSTLGPANQSMRNITFSPRQGTPENHPDNTANGLRQIDGTGRHPFMFGYQNQNPAHQMQTQGTRTDNPYSAFSPAYQQILHESNARQGPLYGQSFVDPRLTGSNFINPRGYQNDLALPYGAGTVGAASHHETAGPLQAEPEHDSEGEGGN